MCRRRCGGRWSRRGAAARLTRPRADHLAQEEVERFFDRLLHADLRLPAEQLAGLIDAWPAVLNVLIALAVVGAAFQLAVAGERREARAERVAVELGDQHFGQFADAGLVGRIADVDDLAVADAALVFDDAIEALDAIRQVGEAALLRPAVDELDRRALDEVKDELGDSSRAADAGGVEAVQPRAGPVKGPEERELQPFFLAVCPDDAIEELLAARINPALLVDGPEDELGAVLVEFLLVAHAIDLGRGRKDDPLFATDAVADDSQGFLEVQLEYPQRVPRVLDRGGEGPERTDAVGLVD